MADDEFADLEAGYTNDPIPTEEPKKRRIRDRSARNTGKPVGRPSTASAKTEVRQQIDAFIALMAVPIVMRDPHCGSVLMQQRSDIAEALSEIAMKNPALLKMLNSGGDIMMYFKLVTALSPIAITVYQHHFVKKEEEVKYGESFVA